MNITGKDKVQISVFVERDQWQQLLKQIEKNRFGPDVRRSVERHGAPGVSVSVPESERPDWDDRALEPGEFIAFIVAQSAAGRLRNLL